MKSYNATVMKTTAWDRVDLHRSWCAVVVKSFDLFEVIENMYFPITTKDKTLYELQIVLFTHTRGKWFS
jgi:hypothetical protein